MPMLTDNTYRFCSRCHASLDDPASREKGQGPVCSAKDTHLYAKTIPANFAVAMIHALAITPEMLADECRGLWTKVLGTFIKKTETAQKANTENSLIFSGTDLREIVKVADYMCSFSHPDTRMVKTHLIGLVRSLGYVGLAAVLEGKASTSPSKIWFENGRIFMEGLSNTDGFHTMRKIPGASTPRYRGDKTPYSVPAKEFESFKTAVMTHWPMYEGESWDEIETKCWNWRGTHWVADAQNTAPLKPSEPLATIKLRSEDFTLTFVWSKNKNMFSFIEKLKSITSTERSYDPASKIWRFKLSQLETIKAFCVSFFEEAGVSIIQTNEASLPWPMNNRPRYAYRQYRRC